MRVIEADRNGILIIISPLLSRSWTGTRGGKEERVIQGCRCEGKAFQEEASVQTNEKEELGLPHK